MRPSLRLCRAFRTAGWVLLVVWLVACAQVRPAEPTPTLAPTGIPPAPLPTNQPQPAQVVLRYPTSVSLPTARPTPRPVDGYVAYRVKAGDTLMAIGMRGGSDAKLIAGYNRLVGAPQPGRELIVPHLVGRATAITSTKIMVLRGNTTKPWVALTFDCGGVNPRTSELLDTLYEADVQVTFFLHGDSIAQNPELLQRMVREGHELANHSYSHSDFTMLTPDEMRQELDLTETTVRELTDGMATTRPYFRFPYGASSPEAVDTVVAHGYLPVHWTLDTLDSVGGHKTAEEIVERVNEHLTDEEVPGAIILAHCMGSTIEAVPQILAALSQRGIEVHTLTDVLGE
jgi:peptidoglycan/xylan/chitin deacetylase (PgdA/CDA1 family)